MIPGRPQYKKKQLEEEICLFLAFFNLGSGNVDTFLAALVPPPKGRGEVSCRQSPDGPLPLLEGLIIFYFQLMVNITF
jgi:hypothetical protein